jgi:type IV secretory pathway TrbF-like protein
MNPPGTEANPPLKTELARVWPSRIGEAVGAVETVVGALLTVTFTVVVAVRKFVMSVGVKVIPWLEVPAEGAVAGAVKAKEPAGAEVPPVRVELAKVCPKVRVLAVGEVRMVEVALAMVSVAEA